MQFWCNYLICDRVQTLKSTEVLSKKSFDFGETIEDCLEFVSFKNYDSADWVDFGTLNIESCNDSQSPLASDKQLFQIVARIVFHYLRTEVQNLPIRSHCLQS